MSRRGDVKGVVGDVGGEQLEVLQDSCCTPQNPAMLPARITVFCTIIYFKISNAM